MSDDTANDPRQSIADLKRELTRYKAERDEALDQQRAIAEVLQVINSSPGDLGPVFDAMLEKALRLCEAALGHIMTFDGELFHRVATRGEGPLLAAFRRQHPALRPSTDSITLGRILRGDRVVHIGDCRDTEEYRDKPIAREMADRGGMRTLLTVPLRKDDALLGTIHVFRQKVRPFSDKQIALLQNFAAQAVIAMENARLITETREALDQQTATAEVLQVINSSPGDLAPVFDAMLEKAMRLCEAAYGMLWTYDGGAFRAAALHGVPPPYAQSVSGQAFRPTPDGRSAFAQLAEGSNFVRFLDVAAEEAYQGTPGARILVELGGVRTMMVVALRKDATLLGAITAYRQEVRPFSDKQIALLQNFAAQAVIAIENARLITETREALEQQTATAEVLQVINSSPGDLAPVFDAILEKAHSLCGVTIGALLLYDGEQARAVATHGVSEPLVGLIREPFRPRPKTPHARLIDEKRVVHIPDLSTETGIRSRAAAEQGIRTALFVPLLKDDILLGWISAVRQEVRPFTDKQIALLQNFAAQAVIAMENARLITETREALERQTATAEVLGVINSSPGDLAPVFEAILERAHALCGVAYGSLQLYDGEHFRAVAQRGNPEPLAELLRQPYAPAPNGGTGRLIAGDRFYQIDDMAERVARSSAPNPLNKAGRLAGIRTLLFLPLRKDAALLGLIAAARTEVRPFSEKEIRLLENFAAQAVIAMENARLMTETREALEQQTATAEVLQVINSSPGNLAPVFAAMLEKAMRLCEATFGALTRIDGDHFHSVASHNVPLALIEAMRQPRLVVPGNAHYRLLKGEDVVQVADVTAEEIYRSGNPSRRALAELGGARTVLWAALRNDTTLLGAFVIFRQEVRPFSDKQIALLQNFAAQAVIAMENARLLTETREALEQQTATAEVLQVINASPGDLAPVFDAMLEKALHLCGAAFGIINTYDGERFHAAAIRGVAAGLPALPEPGPHTGIGRIARGESLVHIPDFLADEAYQSLDSRARALVEREGVRSYVVVALRKDDLLLGTIGAYRQELRPFTDKQIALLQNFAAQAVIAMENARLLGELRERTDEIAGWNRELEARVATQLAEIERTGKLRRFLAPQLADLILAQDDESILESHRREIVVVFCDLRGFTGFAERAEPEEVMALLADYHAAMGPIVASFEGTLDHYAGDGIMVFFNDPVPTPDPARRAIDMAAAMREAAQALLKTWRRQGHDIGFGVGISQGYATLGQIGFAERMDYTAIGTVTNLAARLCGEAKDGQILVSRRVAIAVEDNATLEEIGDLSLKGLSQAVAVFNVVSREQS